VRHPLPNARVRLVWVGTAEADGTIRVECSAGTPRSFCRGHFPVGRHGRRAGTARKRRADGRHDHREGGRRRAPRRVAGWLPAPRARSLRRGPDRAARFPAQGSRRARRHGHRLRRGRDGGARRDGPPRGKRDPGGKAPRGFRCREASYDELLRNQRTVSSSCARGRWSAPIRRPPRCSGTHPGASVRRRPGFDPGGTGRGGRPARRIAEPGKGEPRREWEATLLRMDGFDLPGEIRITWAPREDKNDTFVPKRRGPLGMGRPSRRDREGAGSPGAPEGARLLEPDAGHLRGTRPAGERGGEILLFNRQCEEATGIAARDARGKRMWDLADRGVGPRPPP